MSSVRTRRVTSPFAALALGLIASGCTPAASPDADDPGIDAAAVDVLIVTPDCPAADVPASAPRSTPGHPGTCGAHLWECGGYAVCGSLASDGLECYCWAR